MIHFQAFVSPKQWGKGERRWASSSSHCFWFPFFSRLLGREGGGQTFYMTNAAVIYPWVPSGFSIHRCALFLSIYLWVVWKSYKDVYTAQFSDIGDRFNSCLSHCLAFSLCWGPQQSLVASVGPRGNSQWKIMPSLSLFFLAHSSWASPASLLLSRFLKWDETSASVFTCNPKHQGTHFRLTQTS